MFTNLFGGGGGGSSTKKKKKEDKQQQQQQQVKESGKPKKKNGFGWPFYRRSFNKSEGALSTTCSKYIF